MNNAVCNRAADSPGYSTCSRMAGHAGPCAHHIMSPGPLNWPRAASNQDEPLRDAEWEDAVRSDIDGSDEFYDELRESQENAVRWRDTLITILQKTDATLTEMRAEDSRRKTRSHQQGSKGKAAYFIWKTDQDIARAKLVAYKPKIVERLREAKAMVHEDSQDENASRHPKDLNARLDRIEKLVLELLDIARKIK